MPGTQTALSTGQPLFVLTLPCEMIPGLPLVLYSNNHETLPFEVWPLASVTLS